MTQSFSFKLDCLPSLCSSLGVTGPSLHTPDCYLLQARSGVRAGQGMAGKAGQVTTVCPLQCPQRLLNSVLVRDLEIKMALP